MSMMRTTSQLGESKSPPSPIPTGTGSRSAANDVIAEFIEKSLHVPELNLPDPYYQANETHHLIPAEIDLRILLQNPSDSFDRLLRSAREFGAFRISCHGISAEELKLLANEAGRVFSVLEDRDGGGRRNPGGNREEIVWVRSLKDKMEWARECIGQKTYQSFSQEMENVACKLEAVAELLCQTFVDHATKQYGKKISKGESVLSVYRYNHDNVIDQTPTLPKEKNRELLDYTLSLHLPEKNSEFRIQSEKGPLFFHAHPDTIVVTVGEQLEKWSDGEFKCVSGEIVYKPDNHRARASFSIELKYSSLFMQHSSKKTYKAISLFDQILIAILIGFLYYLFQFISS